MIIGPEVIDEIFDLFFHEGAVGYSCLVGVAPEFEDVIVLIEFFAEVMVFFSELVDFYFCEIGFDEGIGVGFALAG